MEEKYSNIIKEAEVLFDSILKDSLLVQKDTLYEGYPMNPIIKQNIEVCVTDNTWSYGIKRHLNIDYLRNLGLKIKALKDDAELQDKVLSIHHSTMITISSTKAAKIIENQNGVSFINTIG